jgi:FAD/FMN-containing dehydrogenase
LLRSNRTNVIYGTVRLVEKDDESFLAWAKESYACIIFNLLTLHTPSGIEASARSFRGLIDLAIARGGSYYLTYHKFAKPEQVIACYPQFKEFLNLKKKYDPNERFQSDWYRYYRKLFAS